MEDDSFKARQQIVVAPVGRLGFGPHPKDFLAVVLAGNGPATVKSGPFRHLAEKFGMIMNEEFIPGIDDLCLRPLRTGVGQKVLDMSRTPS